MHPRDEVSHQRGRLAPVTCHCGDLGEGSGGGERELSSEQMNGTQ